MNDLAAFGLSPELTAKMEAAKRATAERCPVCKVGSGRFCVDVEGVATYDGIHIQRTIWADADELTRAAYLSR